MKFHGKMGKIFLLLVSVIVPMCCVIRNTHMRIHLQRCTAACNKKYCNVSTVCRPLNRTSKMKSLDVYIHPGIKLDHSIYVELKLRKKIQTVYRDHMIQLKEELCPLLLKKDHPLFKIIDPEVMERINAGVYGNFLEPCPLSGHRYLKPRITNSEDDAYHIPLVPFGDWEVEVSITKNDELLLKFSDFYEVKPTGVKQF